MNKLEKIYNDLEEYSRKNLDEIIKQSIGDRLDRNVRDYANKLTMKVDSIYNRVLTVNSTKALTKMNQKIIKDTFIQRRGKE